MSHVGILATGRAESEGIPGALEQLFNHTFAPIFMRTVDREPFGNINTPPSPVSSVHSTALKIVQKVASELERNTFDFIVILDDLELTNLARPGQVVEHMRLAVLDHLETAGAKGWGNKNELVRAFRERVSFHLAVPMLEAWFFADLDALIGLQLNTPPKLVDGSDPEAFTTADCDYASDQGSACIPWQHLPPAKRKLLRPPWTCADPTHHPKAYLSWLMKDPREKGCSRYREIAHGVSVLEALDWQRTLRDPAHYSYLRAFLQDLSIALNVPLPWLDGPAAGVPTMHIHGGSVLRNV
jgi:hypothetical protein